MPSYAYFSVPCERSAWLPDDIGERMLGLYEANKDAQPDPRSLPASPDNQGVAVRYLGRSLGANDETSIAVPPQTILVSCLISHLDIAGSDPQFRHAIYQAASYFRQIHDGALKRKQHLFLPNGGGNFEGMTLSANFSESVRRDVGVVSGINLGDKPLSVCMKGSGFDRFENTSVILSFSDGRSKKKGAKPDWARSYPSGQKYVM